MIDWQTIGIIAAVMTLLITFLSFFLAFKGELKKNSNEIIKARISEERRHSSHEQRLSLIEERMNLTEGMITYRLDEISQRLIELNNNFN